jgi:hypothetical protein
VGAQEEGAHPVEKLIAPGPVALEELPARWLDLDHVRSHVGEILDAGRSEEKLGKAQDPDPL